MFASGTYAKMARIRDHARRIAKNNGLLNECSVCGTKDCIETCHIKEVAKFSKDTPIKDINKLSNLIGLCSSCHTKLHKKLISIKLIKAKVELRESQLSLF